jgi:sterol desaturase/sphingolipid hydroxylase (fatty acid hydroxylase superfamily)
VSFWADLTRADLSPQEWAIPGFILLMVVERVSYRWFPDPAERGYGGKDTATSITMGLGSIFADLVIGSVTGLLTLWCAGVTPLRIPSGLGWTWLSVFVAWDFCYYWAHRAEHEIRILWAGHVTHHSSRYFNLSTALRQAWTGQATVIFYAPLALAGASLPLIATVGGVNLLYQFWIHTERIERMPRWFEAVMNTPSHHRVHHGSNSQYLDRNYAGVFIVWDRAFGTFEPEVEPVRYGLTTNIQTYNPIWVAVHEYASIGRDLRRARGWSERFGYLFRHPGWTPATRTEPVAEPATA